MKIQEPCKDCPLYVGSGESVEDIYDKRLLPMAKDGLERALGCKHPWRVAFKRFDGEIDSSAEDVLGTLVTIRGKDPADYGLKSSD